MGVYHDKIAAEVAAREGLLASAGVGKLHLRPMRDRSLVQARTRNIRRIRNQAAAALGVLPAQVVQADPDGKGLREFRVDFHIGRGIPLMDRYGRYGIFASAFDLSAEKHFVVGAAHKERFRFNAAPTGRRTDKVIGVNSQGDPVFEVVEDRQGALLSHLTQQIVRHISPYAVDSPEGRALPELGSTVDTVYPDADAWVSRSYVKEIWSTFRTSAGIFSGISDGLVYCGVRTYTTTDRWRDNHRSVSRYDLSSYASVDSASYMIYGDSSSNTLASPVIHFIPSTVPVSPSAGHPSDYNIGNHTYTSKGSIALADFLTGAYNEVVLDTSILTLGADTYITAVEESDLNDTPYAWASNKYSRLVWKSSNATGTSQDQHLEITSTPAPAASGSSLAMRMALDLV